MKKIFLALVLSMVTLLPSLQAKSSMSLASRVLNITIEGWVLFGTSDDKSGAIQEVQVYNVLTGQLALDQKFDDYSVSVNLKSLKAGVYVVDMIATNDVLKQQIALNL